ncbi:MAG: hypothetical protein P8L68_05875 [Paracoccaceae bacterium]|nr:hypothetical protein [Paracoccaceae bacterium]MDG2258004.1 hypothetical protein [Paracoccaceae bacterium]
MAETITEIARLELPYRRRAILKEVVFDGGMQMTRLVIKEGTRITQVDLDAQAAENLGKLLVRSAQSGEGA